MACEHLDNLWHNSQLKKHFNLDSIRSELLSFRCEAIYGHMATILSKKIRKLRIQKA